MEQESGFPPETDLPQPRHAVALFLLTFLVQIVVLVLLGFLWGLGAVVSPEAVVAGAELAVACVLLASTGALVWLVVWFTRRLQFDFRRTLALYPAPGSAYLWAVVGGLALTTVGEELLLRLFPAFFRPAVGELQPLLSLSAFPLALLVLALTLGAGLSEELIFRGFILTGLGSRLSAGPAVLATALLFAVAHVEPSRAVLVLPLGVWLGWVVRWTGSVYPAIALHAVNNGLAIVVVGLFPGFVEKPYGFLPLWGYFLCVGLTWWAGLRLRRSRPGPRAPSELSYPAG
jgi:membrane protease YdiL (CAAX protease family)